jgi:hypothetical protein
MERPASHPMLRLLPSMTDVAFVLPMIFLFTRMKGTATLLGDGDTGWHIRAGEWMLANGRVIDTDVFSYTKPGETWYAWEWLWDLAFGWLHQTFGMASVLAASLLVLGLTSALLFRLCLRHTRHPLIAFGVVFLANAASTVHWLARPHLFTLLFVVVLLTVLDRVEEGRTWLLWLLPALTALWANIHGGFLAGIIILGAYGAGEAATGLISADGTRLRPGLRKAAIYLGTAMLCLTASLANPHGYRLHVHIYRYLTESYHFDSINEFQSFNFHLPTAPYVELTLALAALAAFRSLRRGELTAPLLLAVWAHEALGMVRNVPIFALVTAPLAAAALDQTIAELAEAPVGAWIRGMAARLSDWSAEWMLLERPWRVHLISSGALLLVLAVMNSPSAAKRFQPEYDAERYPAKAAGLLAGPGCQEGIFTDDEWGDYLIYRLYPKCRVFIDGRSDFYGPQFGKDYDSILDVKYNWQDLLDRYRVTTVLLRANLALTSTLKQSQRWQVVYDDGRAILFRTKNHAPSDQPAERVTSAFKPESGVSASVGGGISRGTATYSNQRRKTKV